MIARLESMNDTNISLATAFAGLELHSCLYNASGPWCTTREDLDSIGKSSSGAILTKSCTLEERAGNPSPRYYENQLGSINSMGLPNKGYKFYGEIAADIQSDFDKPYLISVSGLSLKNNLYMLAELNGNSNVSAIELNLSCPNVPGKPQTAYDFKQVVHVLTEVTKVNAKPLGIKLPPYFDIIHFEEMAAIINEFEVSFVTCVNSIGNGLVIDVEKEAVVIRPKGGFGGIGGDYIKPTALANVRKFRELLRKDIAVIACGGVKNGVDAFEHILCGADAVQIGTQYHREGTSCFSRIAAELQDIMKNKGYAKLSDFKGKLIQY